MKSPDILTTKEAAEVLGCSTRAITNMVHRGELTKIRVSGKVVYMRDQVIALKQAREYRSPRLNELDSLRKMLEQTTSYLTRLEARVNLLEHIIQMREDPAKLNDEEVDLLKSLALSTIGIVGLPHSEIQKWAKDINRIPYESAKRVGIMLLYTLVEHLNVSLTTNEEFLSGLDLYHVRDQLMMAKYKILGFAQIAGINHIERPPLISSVLNAISENVN